MQNKLKEIMSCKLMVILVTILLLANILFLNIWCKTSTDQFMEAYIINALLDGATDLTIDDKVVIENGVIVAPEWQYLYNSPELAGLSQNATSNNDKNTSDSNETANGSSSKKSNDVDKTANSNLSANTNTNTEKQYSDEEIEAAWEETDRIESTCTEIGHVHYTNSITGETKTEELPLADHNYVENERKEATCTEAGVITYACEVCGDTYTEEIPALNHEYEWVTTKEATLFTPGEEQYICKNCGDISETREIAAKCSKSVIIGLALSAFCIAGATALLIKIKNKRKRDWAKKE